LNTTLQLAATLLAVLLSVSTSALAGTEVNRGGVIPTGESSADLPLNATGANGGIGRITVGNFSGDSVTRDITKTGVATDALAMNSAPGGSTAVMLVVTVMIAFGLTALLGSTQSRRKRHGDRDHTHHTSRRRQRDSPY
jgi:hypothetical protein